MRQLNFVKDAVLKLNGVPVTDHNRSPLAISYERLENKIRTQRGAMRKYFRADKRLISCSWENVPENNNHTVDAGMGVNELRNFYELNTGAFTVDITYSTGVTETFTMVFDELTAELLSRKGNVNLYTMSMALEEV